MSFVETHRRHRWRDAKRLVESKTPDVEAALARTGERSLDDFAALVSPAATPFLERMAALSHASTLERFGRTLDLYVPLYLSNECTNVCTYCGFSVHNRLARRTLTPGEIRAEAAAIKTLGFEHILLVTGESNRRVGLDYFECALRILAPLFSHVALEVQPLGTDAYRRLIGLGLNAVLIYQESYNEETYREHHLKGRKADFEHRLETPDRLGEAGIEKIGLGTLLGLENWRVDAWFLALHLAYLRQRYWKTRFSISVPRICSAEGDFRAAFPVGDREWVQLICAYRLFDRNVELSLSTREAPKLRNHVIPLGITTLSAGSKTGVGGYAAAGAALEQFQVNDSRSPQAVADSIRALGYEPVWKNWEQTAALNPES